MHHSRNYLVLGGSGFIGTHLVKRLLSEGHRVTIVNRSPVGKIESRFSNCAVRGQLTIIQSRFDDEPLLDRILPGCDVCVHLAGSMVPSVSIENKIADIQVNLAGTVRLLEIARRHGLAKLIYISSGGTVYGQSRNDTISESHPTDPISAYGITKLAAEKYLQLFQRLHDLPSVILRLANPFGPGQAEKGTQGAIAVFVERILEGKPLEIWGDGSVVRDYLFIDDVVESIMRAAAYSGSHTLFNIGSGRGTSLNEIHTEIGRHFPPFEVHHKPDRSFDVQRNVLDIRRAQEHLGWQPKIKLDEGIARYIAWRKAQITNWSNPQPVDEADAQRLHAH
ncbi:NAD-dependent epimerase/dehydratase family protein [Ochrobactrum vermis]|uniref:NAD-dependent epimerase/dehydratase family protein n=1 Tax=Ochrobactrum vermis TaxID=1827297 RepID=A0ABU8PG82_9HYPH|nr:NAD-dependent epimerase/dehydratase family protein [Ochrobactrum vermis]PQZ25651.1 NAD-dependent epimerase [Ochrobactrum vermis]